MYRTYPKLFVVGFHYCLGVDRSINVNGPIETGIIEREFALEAESIEQAIHIVKQKFSYDSLTITKAKKLKYKFLK